MSRVRLAAQRWIWTVALAGLSTAGCGSSDRLPVVPVGGKVTYIGEPVAGAQVILLGKGNEPAAYGTTAADGTFRLTTYDEHDGAAPGTYIVTVTKLEGGPPSDPNAPFDPVADMEAAAKNQTPEAPARSLLPEKYATAADSPLELTIQPPGNTQVHIELKD